MIKAEAGLFACAMILLVGMIVSTMTMVMFPIIGFFIEMVFMMLVAAVVLSIIVPEIVKELRNK